MSYHLVAGVGGGERASGALAKGPTGERKGGKGEGTTGRKGALAYRATKSPAGRTIRGAMGRAGWLLGEGGQDHE
jgi:hypothetical protein